MANDPNCKGGYVKAGFIQKLFEGILSLSLILFGLYNFSNSEILISNGYITKRYKLWKFSKNIVLEIGGIKDNLYRNEHRLTDKNGDSFKLSYPYTKSDIEEILKIVKEFKSKE